MNDWSSPPPPPANAPPANPTHNPYAPPPANPYAPPSARLTVSGSAPDDAERIRHELLSHEASLRSVGLLYGLGAIFGAIVSVAGVLFGIFMLVTGETSFDGMGIGLMAGFLGFYIFLTWINYYLAKGYRSLDPKIRTAATIIAALGLLGFPIGTLISIYILYLLHSEKGKRVMTTEYQAIIAQTPHIKYKTPLWLILALMGIVAAVVFIIMASV